MKKTNNRQIRVDFDHKNGSICSIRHHGMELAVPAEEAFTLQLLDRTGNSFLLKSSEFKFDGNGYFAHPGFPSLQVKLNRSSDSEFIRFCPEVTGVPDTHVLEWIDAPQVVFRHGNKLLLPLHDGVEISNPCHRSSPYHPISFARRGTHYGYFFPGRCQMQFMAVYDEIGGFYFASHDSACGTKAVEYDPAENSTRLSLQTFTGCDFGQDYYSGFDYVIGGFYGGWMAACSIYRDWFESYAPKPAPFPEWLKSSPIILIYPVRGHGLDIGEMEPNCYFPYTEMLPHVERFNVEFKSPVMPLLMHWEGTAPWAPPYVWPPYGGEEKLAQFRDKLHDKGNLLGVYCSGTAWTCQSSITDYAPGCTPEQEKQMLCGPKGELEATVCNGLNSQRLGYDLCLAEPWSRNTVKNEILKLAAFGIDYAQFYDQNHGGGLHLCYSHNHHHPPVPGAWQITVMRNLMLEVDEEIRSMNAAMALGCESAAAEPYLNYLVLNDARASFLYGSGRPVPAQSFVFHGRTNCFSGNQCGVSRYLEFEASPWNLLYRIAYAFNAGELLALLLKEDGKPHWCWRLPWNMPGPDPEPIYTLVRNLNAIRRKYPQFLLYGRMLEPQLKIKGRKLTLPLKEDRSFQIDAFLHSAWQSPKGEKIEIITNFLPEPQNIVIAEKTQIIPPLDAVIIKSCKNRKK